MNTRRLLLLVHVPDDVDTIDAARPYLETGYVVAMPVLGPGHEYENATVDLAMAYDTLTSILPAQYGGPRR